MNSFTGTKLKLKNTGQDAHCYCHPSSVLSFVIPGLDPGLTSWEKTALERLGDFSDYLAVESAQQ